MALVAGALILSMPDRVLENDGVVVDQGGLKGGTGTLRSAGGESTGGSGGKSGGKGSPDGGTWGYKDEMDDDHDDDDARGMLPYVVSEPPPGSQPGYVGTIRGPSSTTSDSTSGASGDPSDAAERAEAHSGGTAPGREAGRSWEVLGGRGRQGGMCDIHVA